MSHKDTNQERDWRWRLWQCKDWEMVLQRVRE